MMIRARQVFVVLAITAIAATPVLHHHALTPSLDGDSLNSVQNVCAICLHATDLTPEPALVAPVTIVSPVEQTSDESHASPPLTRVSSRAPPVVA